MHIDKSRRGPPGIADDERIARHRQILAKPQLAAGRGGDDARLLSPDKQRINRQRIARAAIVDPQHQPALCKLHLCWQRAAIGIDGREVGVAEQRLTRAILQPQRAAIAIDLRIEPLRNAQGQPQDHALSCRAARRRGRHRKAMLDAARPVVQPLGEAKILALQPIFARGHRGLRHVLLPGRTAKLPQRKSHRHIGAILPLDAQTFRSHASRKLMGLILRRLPGRVPGGGFIPKEKGISTCRRNCRQVGR